MTVLTHNSAIEWRLPLKFRVCIVPDHATPAANLYNFWSTFGVFRGEKLYLLSTCLHQQLRMKLATVPLCARVCPPNLVSLVSTCRRFLPGHLDFFPMRLSAPRVIVSYFSAALPSFPAVDILQDISPPSSNLAPKLGTCVPPARADTLEQTRVQSEPASLRNLQFYDCAASVFRGVTHMANLFVLFEPRFL